MDVLGGLMQQMQQQQQQQEQEASEGKGSGKRGKRPHAGAPIYMASLDVVKSFDSINHDKLMTVVDDLLSHADEYSLRRCPLLLHLPLSLSLSTPPSSSLSLPPPPPPPLSHSF